MISVCVPVPIFVAAGTAGTVPDDSSTIRGSFDRPTEMLLTLL